MIVTVIIACEIGFWVLLAAGLATRYILRRRRLSTALLVSVPLVDLVLLVATVADLARGATAGFGHGLAAVYLGFSVAFGHSIIRWADERFAHWFDDGPEPWRPPRSGAARTRYEWREFGKALLAAGTAAALLTTAILVVDDGARTAALEGWLWRIAGVVAIWSIWPISHTLWPRRPGGRISPR